MGSADLHIHTTTGYDGTASVAETLEHVATHTRLNLIAITDHDEIDGALEALALAPRYGVQVIPGIEVSTLDGHLLALEGERMVPPGLALPRTSSSELRGPERDCCLERATAALTLHRCGDGRRLLKSSTDR